MLEDHLAKRFTRTRPPTLATKSRVPLANAGMMFLVQATPLWAKAKASIGSGP